jgi:hypothetical protein
MGLKHSIDLVEIQILSKILEMDSIVSKTTGPVVFDTPFQK